MSVIVHRCKCGATQANHGPDTNKFRAPGCTGESYGPPELAPTFDRNGQRVERIVPPGNTELLRIKACSCADCSALYDSLAPVGAVEGATPNER